MFSFRCPSRLVLYLLVLTAGTLNVSAQSYPSRSVRLIVSVAPGGGMDFVGRLVAARLSETMGQPVVVDNRVGAGNIVGTEIVARAAPDGYTLTMANNSSHGVEPALKSKLPYDVIKDFTPIVVIASAPQLMVIGNTLPAKSVKEFVALAKSKPGQLNFGSGGPATQTHLAGEMFMHVSGTRLTHVPYNGVGPAFTALLGAEIQLLFAPTTGAMAHIQAGRLRALGITGTKRSQLVPDIPTLSEQGISGFEAGAWYALLGPAHLPKSVVTRLNQEVVKMANTPEFKQRLITVGAEAVGSTPEACAQVIRDEIAKWTKLVKDTGIRVD